MQILTYLTMDKPQSLEGDYVRDEKTKVLRAIKPIDIKDAVMAQYTGDGGDKHGYLEDDSVENKQSKTETFAEMVVKIDNDRWRDVPILMRTAKAVDKDLGRVVVQFKQPRDSLFPADTSRGPNELIIQLMPEHKITWNLNGKLPGMEGKPTKAPLELDYKQAYPNDRAPDAYEVVIREVLKGNETSCEWKFGGAPLRNVGGRTVMLIQCPPSACPLSHPPSRSRRRTHRGVGNLHAAAQAIRGKGWPQAV